MRKQLSQLPESIRIPMIDGREVVAVHGSPADPTVEMSHDLSDDELEARIERGDMVALKDELGDLLFQVVFYAQMANEDGVFDFDAIVAAIADKMVRRHPHVFGDTEIGDAEAQTVAWEDIKAQERDMIGHAESTLSGVTVALPALTRANKLQKRASRVGFDWEETRQVVGKVREEITEIEEELAGASDKHRLEDEVGDLLFSCVNLARKLGLEPETALRHGNGKFERRFRCMERQLARSGLSLSKASLGEMMVFWNAAKVEEAANG